MILRDRVRVRRTAAATERLQATPQIDVGHAAEMDIRDKAEPLLLGGLPLL
jgi:hypothetical protein